MKWPRETRTIPLAIFVGVLSVYLLYWWFVDWMYPPAETDGGGNFGEKFGGVDALFSALALAGVLYTILLQRRDLQAQKTALEAAEREQDRRTFETIFFNLLTLHHQSLNALCHPRADQATNPANRLSGRRVFEKFVEEVTAAFRAATPDAPASQVLASLAAALGRVELARNPDVWAYTQNLCVLMRFLDSKSVDTKDDYLNIFRAQLSQQEQTWILCYSLSENGDECKRLIEKHQLLSGWRPAGSLGLLEKCLEPSAFGRSKSAEQTDGGAESQAVPALPAAQSTQHR
jgi:hypothetical protein